MGRAAKAEQLGTTPAPKTLADLTRAWATAKAAEETAKREADRLRAEIATFAEAVPGYADDSLKIGETSKLDLADKKLLAVLREEHLLDKVTEPAVRAELVHAAAKFNERLARQVERATSKTPRFEQVRKKD